MKTQTMITINALSRPTPPSTPKIPSDQRVPLQTVWLCHLYH